MAVTEPFGPKPETERVSLDRKDLLMSSSRIYSSPAAQTYSRFVSVMRWALPILALALFVMLLVEADVDQSNVNPLLLASKIASETGGDQLGVQNPKYLGTDNNQQPFMVTASKAEFDPKQPDAIELFELKADIQMKDGSWTLLESKSGLYDRKARLLFLDGEVKLFTDQGHEAVTEAALVNLANNVATIDTPVKARGPMGDIHSNRATISDRGRHMLFEGAVKVTIQPKGSN